MLRKNEKMFKYLYDLIALNCNYFSKLNFKKKNSSL